jgi:UDP-N-acetyl-D-mannosaminuronic acid transferase (WecB/TagA/CpsF family)
VPNAAATNTIPIELGVRPGGTRLGVARASKAGCDCNCATYDSFACPKNASFGSGTAISYRLLANWKLSVERLPRRSLAKAGWALNLCGVTATEQILGLRFLVGSAAEAVAEIKETGGYLVVPAAPALVRLQKDEIYSRAMVNADVVIPDSGLMVLLWKVLHRKGLTRISGLAYLKHLIHEPEFRHADRVLFVLPSELSKSKLLGWAEREQFAVTADDCYVAPRYNQLAEDRPLVSRLENRRPAHIVVAIGNGPQEKLGYFLRENLPYRPAIHCIGAALGFLTGDQVAIPDWADRFYFGWLFRLFAQPRVFVPRLTRALQLPWLILRYGQELPAGRQAEAEQRTENREHRTDRD